MKPNQTCNDAIPLKIKTKSKAYWINTELKYMQVIILRKLKLEHVFASLPSNFRQPLTKQLLGISFHLQTGKKINTK